MDSVATGEKEVKKDMDRKEAKQVLSVVKEKYEGMRRIDPQALIEQALANNSGVEALERLFILAKDVRAEQAREKWNEAMAEFQNANPRIKKTKIGKVADKFSYKYAPLEEILRVVQPIMAPLGLSISWRNKFEPGRVISNCRISHDLGHFEESGEVSMPISEDKMGATGAQRVGIALTYSKRYSLLSIIGLSPEEDTDAQGPREGTGSGVEMPRRASAPKEPAGNDNPWIGVIEIVKTAKGKSGDKEWTLYIIKAKDGQEFKTFSDSDGQFAMEAGKSPVSILWEADPKGGRKIVTIEPATD